MRKIGEFERQNHKNERVSLFCLIFCSLASSRSTKMKTKIIKPQLKDAETETMAIAAHLLAFRGFRKYPSPVPLSPPFLFLYSSYQLHHRDSRFLFRFNRSLLLFSLSPTRLISVEGIAVLFLVRLH